MRARLKRYKHSLKLGLANILGVHNEPVFMCPVDGCTHTANYGRDIWNHLYRKHHTRVYVAEEYDL